jgi:hypothetical protein
MHDDLCEHQDDGNSGNIIEEVLLEFSIWATHLNTSPLTYNVAAF